MDKFEATRRIFGVHLQSDVGEISKGSLGHGFGLGS